MNLHNIPMPRPLSVLLISILFLFSWLEKLTHSEINSWIATIAGCAAILNYIITWYSKLKTINMKKLLLILAQKMEPSIIQNIISRLASKTPKMFVKIQLYCLGIGSILTTILEILTTHQIPDFKYEDFIVIGIKFLIALIAGIGGSCSLHTTDDNINSQSNETSIQKDK